MTIGSVKYKISRLSTQQIIALGFAGVIFIGGILLWLPISSTTGYTSFIDAMFTSATCICVTGLVTVTTATHWTLFGKIIILILIQIGGIGLIALTSIIFITFRRRISLRSRKIIQESYNLEQMHGIVKTVKKVIACVAIGEIIGAILYSFEFIPTYGLLKGIWKSVFISVSAFCNAGVDILGENSLAPFVNDPLVNFTTMALIISAGLGFTVWWDIGHSFNRFFKKEIHASKIFRSLRLQSKIVITVSTILIIAGTLGIFVLEYKNPQTIGGLNIWEKLMASTFQSVTTRTAGFFTINQGGLTNASVMICLLLMFIGGSPMGTAGGIKTTTFAVLVLSVTSSMKGSKDVETYSRRLKDSYVKSAVVVAVMGFFIVSLNCLLLASVMPHTAFADVVFEVISAIGTVGLSRGITDKLPLFGKIIIIITMYLGRIGPLTLGTAVVAKAQKRSDNTHLAEEEIMIG